MSKLQAKAAPTSQMQSQVAAPQVASGALPSRTETSHGIKSSAKVIVRTEDPYDVVHGNDKYKTFIIKPSSIKKVWGAGSNMKEEIFNVFYEHFKPKSSLEPERVEYNEMNIFSEFQLYNLVFAKNELLLDDYKSAMLVNLFWRLLEFNPPEPTSPTNKKDEIPPLN